MSKALITIAGALLSCAALTGCDGYSDKDIEFISLGDVRSLTQEAARNPSAALIIDARPAKYYAAEHITGAANIELPEVDERAGRKAKLEAYSEMVVYGDDPGSAEARGLTKRLMSVGYKDVRLFAGGLKEWKAAGMPTESVTVVTPAAR